MKTLVLLILLVATTAIADRLPECYDMNHGPVPENVTQQLFPGAAMPLRFCVQNIMGEKFIIIVVLNEEDKRMEPIKAITYTEFIELWDTAPKGE